MKIEAIDLFCGIGGLTYGLRKANVNVLAGLDSDPTCEGAYEANNDSKFICADVSQYDFTKLKDLYSPGSIRVLVGCAPCQPFSTHSHKIKNKEDDIRWTLIDYFVEAIRVIEPHIISMENVRGLTKTSVYEKFLGDLADLGFKVDAEVVYCPDYGVPQSRSRLVLLGSRLGKIKVPKPTHSRKNHRTVRSVIGKMPTLRAGETNSKDPLHRTKDLSPLNIQRIKASRPDGSWRDWDAELLPTCYKKESGQSYTAVYGRMSWDSVSPTMTTQFTNYGSGRFGHPVQDRALSLREGALLQTFPKKYNFGKPTSLAQVSRHIGNAVPPRLGVVIGNAIRKHAEGHYDRAIRGRVQVRNIS